MKYIMVVFTLLTKTLTVSAAEELPLLTHEEFQSCVVSLKQKALAEGISSSVVEKQLSSVNFDPRNASHLRLHELYVAGTKFDMAIGLSDGVAVPTLGTDDMFDLPPARSFITTNRTYVADFPVDIASNAVVTSGLTLQLSGLKTIFPKV